MKKNKKTIAAVCLFVFLTLSSKFQILNPSFVSAQSASWCTVENAAAAANSPTIVNDADVKAVLDYWGEWKPCFCAVAPDINNDGMVNSFDYACVHQLFGQTVSSGDAGVNPPASAYWTNMAVPAVGDSNVFSDYCLEGGKECATVCQDEGEEMTGYPVRYKMSTQAGWGYPSSLLNSCDSKLTRDFIDNFSVYRDKCLLQVKRRWTLLLHSPKK